MHRMTKSGHLYRYTIILKHLLLNQLTINSHQLTIKKSRSSLDSNVGIIDDSNENGLVSNIRDRIGYRFAHIGYLMY